MAIRLHCSRNRGSAHKLLMVSAAAEFLLGSLSGLREGLCPGCAATMMGCARDEMVKATKELILDGRSWLRTQFVHPVGASGQSPAFVGRDSETESYGRTAQANSSALSESLDVMRGARLRLIGELGRASGGSRGG
jgi:hypothetical protein